MSDRSEFSLLQGRRALLPRPISARRGGLVVVCALGGTGLLFAWQAAQLDIGGIGLPGPGFFPLLLGAALVGLAALTGIELLRQARDDRTVEFGHRDVLIVFAALLAVPFLFEPLGAFGTLTLFGAALLVFIARTSVVIAAIAGVVAQVACWYFFQQLLGLQLPTGWW